MCFKVYHLVIAGRDSLVGRARVVGSNLPTVQELTLGGHSSSSFTIPRCKIGTRSRPGKSELTLRIHYVQATESAGHGASILALKPMGGVNQSTKQEAPMTPQNDDIVTAKKKKKKKKKIEKRK